MSAAPAAGAPAAAPPPDASRPLAGFRIGVTSDRRSAELVHALERRGAAVVHAPLLRLAPLEEDAELLAATREVVAAAPGTVLVTTGYGLRRWLDAADAHGIGHDLLAVLGRAAVRVRGPKACGAVRAAGLAEESVAADGLTATMVDAALAAGVAGTTVAVQLHGLGDAAQVARLRAAGARVVEVSPYRWLPAADGAAVDRLVGAACSGGLDLVTFTAAPAVDALFAAAARTGGHAALLGRFHSDLMAAAVGDVTAAPLRALGIEPIVPDRHRLGALVRSVTDRLSAAGGLRVQTRLGECTLQGTTVSLGGSEAALAGAPLAVFRVLARAGGAVVPRAELAAHLPEGGGDHALDMAVSRLRRTLPDPRLVATVIKRGYRLSV